MAKKKSKVNKRLAMFLIQLAIDPATRKAFLENPNGAMADAKLNSPSRKALLESNSAKLEKLLDVSNQVQTVVARAARTKGRGAKKR